MFRRWSLGRGLCDRLNYANMWHPHIGMCGKPASRLTKVEDATGPEAGDKMFDPYGAERTVNEHGSSAR